MDKVQLNIGKALANSLVERKLSHISGYGLFALRSFNKGDIICSYNGQIISNDDYQDLSDSDERIFYALEMPGDKMVIPDKLDEVGGHTANHSCKPNSIFALFRGKMVVRANENILSGSEVTVSYGTYLVDTVCTCGEDFCTGKISYLTKHTNGRNEIKIEDAIKFIDVSYHNKNLMMLSEILGSLMMSSYDPSMEFESFIVPFLTRAYGNNWKNNDAALWARNMPHEIRKSKHAVYMAALSGSYQ